MSSCKLSLAIDRPDRTFGFGEEVTGMVTAEPRTDCRCERLAVEREWRTHGRTDRNSGREDDLTIWQGELHSGEVYRLRFRFPAPTGPATYHGHDLNVDWYIRARAHLLPGNREGDPTSPEQEFLLLPTRPVSSSDTAVERGAEDQSGVDPELGVAASKLPQVTEEISPGGHTLIGGVALCTLAVALLLTAVAVPDLRILPMDMGRTPAAAIGLVMLAAGTLITKGASEKRGSLDSLDSVSSTIGAGLVASGIAVLTLWGAAGSGWVILAGLVLAGAAVVIGYVLLARFGPLRSVDSAPGAVAIGIFCLGLALMSSSLPYWLWVAGGLPAIAGMGLVYLATRYRKVGRLTIGIRPVMVWRGGRVKCQVKVPAPRAESVREAEATIQGWEVVVSGSGTQQTIERRVLYSRSQRPKAASTPPESGCAEFATLLVVPENVALSFSSAASHTTWGVTLRIQLAEAPGFDVSYPITVRA